MAAATTAPPASAVQLIDDINSKYELAHRAYEDNFWSTKMGLKGASAAELAASKTAYEAFLAAPGNLAAVRAALGQASLSDQQRHVLRIMEKTFRCYTTDDPEAAQLKERLNELEAQLAQHRGAMALGYTDPASAKFVKASSVQLRSTMRTNQDEATRKAAWEGLCSVGPYVVERLCEIVVLRNRLARKLGYQDFYDYKVSTAEGFSKQQLFEMLAPLEERTRQLAADARAALAAAKGPDALQPWNTSFAMSGDVEKEMDPYFPFEEAVDVWARTFAALGIRYRGALMRLDLCDREGKYSNGFCHWPQPAWRKADGTWVPSAANFTSLASPAAIGSGRTALATLLHEGGHAAHFANIDQPSPLFSQERAPTSVAYAENQSMFLDSLMGDAAWKGRYALSRDGQVIPFGLIEKSIRATHPYAVFGVRTMLAVPYFEKALYELPEERVTPGQVLALAAATEQRVEGGPAPRPLLSVPHILADESSAYYHAYVLAEMSVHQTRAHFLRASGSIIDNPKVGQDLEQVYWRPGNGEAFLDLVARLTGGPLSADAWLAELAEPIDQRLARERRDYDAAVAAGPAIPPGGRVDLDMAVQLVHGDELVADSRQPGGLAGALRDYKAWLRSTFFADKS